MLCVAVAALALLRPAPQHLRRLGSTVASPAIAALPLAASADEAPWDTFIASSEARELGVFFAQTLISWGVPAVVLLFTILLASGPGPDGDGADSLSSNRPPRTAVDYRSVLLFALELLVAFASFVAAFHSSPSSCFGIAARPRDSSTSASNSCKRSNSSRGSRPRLIQV